MWTAKQKLGKKGEEIAAQYLEKKGYEIIGRNIRVGRGEIDIIAKNKRGIVFVEVKTRKFNKEFSIFDSVGYAKKEKIIETCENWLYENNLEREEWRIDFVGITFKVDGIFEIEHLEGGIN
ncbi:MAG TPA: YraN family protein [bacterium]|nr:YraN family protein [bacterium]